MDGDYDSSVTVVSEVLAVFTARDITGVTAANLAKTVENMLRTIDDARERDKAARTAIKAAAALL